MRLNLLIQYYLSLFKCSVCLKVRQVQLLTKPGCLDINLTNLKRYLSQDTRIADRYCISLNDNESPAVVRVI